jgi:4-amino-4-deoxy-L-arabinose transferase-like glycosyltransferase
LPKNSRSRRLFFFADQRNLFHVRNPASGSSVTSSCLSTCIFVAVNPATPAIVSQSAVRRLPRLALVLFCVAYVLPGFLGREPWKNDDVTAFGVMLEMATGHGGWWHPQVLGLAVEEAGPLPYWLGALGIKLFPFLSTDLAARVPFGLLLALTLTSTWYTVYQLARQPAAQPVIFAFGGEASPTDYARAMADAGLLALIASLGLAQLSHETTPDLARLAMVSTMLFAASRLARSDDRRSPGTVVIWGLAALALVFSGAPWITLLHGVGLLVLTGIARRTESDPSGYGRSSEANGGHRDPWRWAVALFVLALACAIALGTLGPPRLQTPLPLVEWSSWGRLLLWFTWPAWPLTVWTLWRWRRQLLKPHVALPLWILLVSVGDSIFSDERDRALLLALPAFAALAAFALPTLRRSVSALIDWFTLLFFTGGALVIWVIWFAMQTGVPAKPAANVARLAPGFIPEFSWLPFLAATMATMAWLWLVSWRVGRHREAIWKSLVLPAAGSTLCWLLLMTLWLPLLDFGRSYGPVSRRIATMVPAQTCVLVDGLSQAQIAALQFHGRLSLRRTTSGPASECRTLVVTPGSQPSLDQRVDLTHWAFKATVSRLTDNKERLLVYQRVGS